VRDLQIDWSQRADDEISTSLRQCQKLLATQTALNTARKSILLSIAKDRLAFAEYQQCLDGLDRVIESAWVKRQKLAVRQQKRKLGAPPLPGTSVRISAKEKERDDREREQQQRLMETVRRAMDRRRLLVDHVGAIFREEEEDEPGRFFGLPKTSVYEGLAVRRSAARL
jgi:transcriptional adapter 3